MKQIIMLDSGAFSAWTKKTSINIDDYIDFYKANKRLINFVVNLDVIPGSPGLKGMSKDIIEDSAKKGYENAQKLLYAGVPPHKIIPVFHQEEDFSWLDKMCLEFEYVGISPANDRSTKSKKVWLDATFDYLKDHKYNVKTHGFGITSTPVISRYPWTSVDSASWMFFSRYGAILVPKYTHGCYDYTKSPNVIFVSGRSPSVKIEGKHFNTLTEIEQHEVIEYIESKGLTFGKSHFEKETVECGFFTEDLIKSKEEIIEEEGVSNDHKLRDLLNTCFYLDVEYNTNIKDLFFAGNFPQMKDREYEEWVTDTINEYTEGPYKRLISFFYKDDIQSVLDIRRDDLNGKERR